MQVQRTMTMQESVATHLVIKLKKPQEEGQTFEEIANKLVKNLTNSPVFSEAMKKEIGIWQTKFQEKLSKPNTEENLKDVVRALCFLLCGGIDPEFETHKDNIEMVDLLISFEDDIRELLSYYVEDVDTVIDEYNKRFAKQEDVIAQVVAIKKLFQTLIAELQSDYQLATKDMQAKVDLIQTKLNSIKAERIQMGDEVNQEVQHLMDKMDKVRNLLGDTLHECSETAFEFEACQHHYIQLIGNGESMVAKGLSL